MSTSPVLQLVPESGSVAVITGGTSGIGAAIVASLRDHGVSVVAGSSSPAKIRTAKDLWSNDQGVTIQRLDVTNKHSVAAAITTAEREYGPVTIFVNCGGVNRKEPISATTEETYDWIMDVNLKGPFFASKVVGAKMVKNGKGGVIINICSVTSYQALSEVHVYAMSKSGLLGMTRQLATEKKWNDAGIRVVGIAPGFVPADQNRKILQSGDRGRRITEGTPQGRFLAPEEIAGTATFLCSPAASGIHGTCIDIDGGFITAGVTDAIFEPKT